jgi:hypothetical protein
VLLASVFRGCLIRRAARCTKTLLRGRFTSRSRVLLQENPADDRRVPLVPTVQQLIVTEPISQARADLPMVRIMDAAVYMRPCQGGFLWGVYEESPRFFDMEALGAEFQVADLSLDAAVLWHYADEVKQQLPILREAKIREHRGGIPTMTADATYGPNNQCTYFVAPDGHVFYYTNDNNTGVMSAGQDNRILFALLF